MAASIPHQDSTTTPNGKVCKKCGEWKPLTKYQKWKNAQGVEVYGRTCRDHAFSVEQRRAYDRKRYAENSTRNHQVKARVKAWHEANKEYVKEENHRRYVALPHNPSLLKQY